MVDDILRHLRTDGFALVEGVVPADEVEAVRDSVQGAVESHQASGSSGVQNLLAHDQSFARYLVNDRIMGVAHALMGEGIRTSFTEPISNPPGTPRGGWHSDWPFHQKNAARIMAPYADVFVSLSTVWMLSPFTRENGGTLVVPGSHREPNNPTAHIGVDPMAPSPTEFQATGDAGAVLLFDSRLWHAVAPNNSDNPRVAMRVCYVPWWLNLDVMRPGSASHRRMADETGRQGYEAPLLPCDVFEGLPDTVKPLYQHWVDD